jgi:RNA polymerase sigma factor (sigma-70 family)
MSVITDQMLHGSSLQEMATAETDRSLVDRFVADRDEAAFRTLMARHGAMVLGVARRLVGEPSAAEDVFQATFLALARRADTIRRADSVGSWLYGVACHLALKARTREARRQRHERRAADRSPGASAADISCREWIAVLDEELLRLPETLRLPLVLCYLEGLTQDEAAHHLNWSLSTLRRRLDRGREVLRLRLTRRGIAFSSALVALAVTIPARAAVLPRSLVRSVLGMLLGAAIVLIGLLCFLLPNSQNRTASSPNQPPTTVPATAEQPVEIGKPPAAGRPATEGSAMKSPPPTPSDNFIADHPDHHSRA